jgi:hypothetical protein
MSKNSISVYVSADGPRFSVQTSLYRRVPVWGKKRLVVSEPEFVNVVKKPRKRLQGINSTIPCSLAESIPVLLKRLHIRAQVCLSSVIQEWKKVQKMARAEFCILAERVIERSA